MPAPYNTGGWDYPAPSATERSTGMKSSTKIHQPTKEGVSGQFSRHGDIKPLREGGTTPRQPYVGYHRADSGYSHSNGRHVRSGRSGGGY